MTRGTREIHKSLKKDWRKLAEAMRDDDWTFEQGAKHPKAFAPDGMTWTTLTGSPSDRRALKNATAVYRRWCRENGRMPRS
jgi:hypothetical protein